MTAQVPFRALISAGLLAGLVLSGSTIALTQTLAPPPAAADPSSASVKNAADSAATPAPSLAALRPAALPADVPVPSDPVEKAAFDVLDKHCARCHQAGLLTSRDKPAKNFGNVLKLDEIAADPHLVQAGNPDGSKLLQQLVNKEMPYDLYYEFDDSKPEVTAADIDALRAWIQATGSKEAAACAGRSFVKNPDVVETIATDLAKREPVRARGTRYLLLTNLYNSCASDEALKVYRQGAVKLLNGLSRQPNVIRLETIDAKQTILAFNLADLGWEDQDWNTVLALYPYAARPKTAAFAQAAAITGSPLPYVRADWFAFAASQPPLYDALLRLPGTFGELARTLGVDVEANIRDFIAQRSGFQKSGVSQNNRLIERHPLPEGYFWTSYDFAGNRDRQSLFRYPLGPGGEAGFRHDGGETLFSLPNGFQAYYLNTARGERLAKGPTQIVRDPTRRDLMVTNGISCMGCHDQGLRKAKDEVRDLVLADASFGRRDKAQVAALYPESAKLDQVIEVDFQRFNAAMRQAGLDPALKLNGVEMTNALFRRYEEDLSLRRAAAEYGLELDGFTHNLAKAGSEAQALVRRLEQGVVPRDQFEALFARFVESATSSQPIKVAALSGAAGFQSIRTSLPSGTFELRLNADKTVYERGETAVFTVMSSRDCSLFVVNVSRDGTGTVIFPNSFQRDNGVKAGQTVTLGGPDAPFKFRLADVGTERVVAVCRVGDTNTRSAFGTTLDLNSKSFYAVPDFHRAFSRQIAVEAHKVRGEAASLDRAGRASAQFAKIATLNGETVAADVPASARQTIATTAIVLEVK